MATFSFRLFGGYKVSINQQQIDIDYLGEKIWFIQKSKPRSKTIVLQDIIRVEYKESGMTFGYVRFITKENEEFLSSTYVAQHDENAFMVEKDELQKLNDVLDVLKKHRKDLEMKHMKA